MSTKEETQAQKDKAKQTLMQITSDAQAVVELLEEFDGDVSDENAVLDVWMRDVQDSLATKVDRYGFAMDQIEARARGLRQLAQEIHRSARTLESHLDAMKNAIKIAMSRLSETKLKGKVFSFTLAKAKASVVIDEAQLPEEYFATVISKAVDREKVDAAIAQGIALPGVSVIEGKALRKTIAKN